MTNALSTGALLLVLSAVPASAQVRVAATVRLSDQVVARVFYGRPVYVHRAPIVVVRPAPVVVVRRPAPVVVHRVQGRRHGRAHARLHRELDRRHDRWHRGHPRGLRVVRYDDD
jgi:hypothetical protein